MSDWRHLNPFKFQRNSLGYQEEFLNILEEKKIIKNYNSSKRFSKTFLNYIGVIL